MGIISSWKSTVHYLELASVSKLPLGLSGLNSVPESQENLKLNIQIQVCSSLRSLCRQKLEGKSLETLDNLRRFVILSNHVTSVRVTVVFGQGA